MPTDNSPAYGYLTPDAFTPTSYICGRLRIPNDQTFLAAVMGALNDLVRADSWEQYGTMSPEDAAYLALTMYNDFVIHRGTCMIGTVVPFATVDPPTGTLVCDGTSYLRVDYPDLYALLLPAYQTDADHFLTPDLRGHVVMGAPYVDHGTTHNPADIIGEVRHLLIEDEIPNHFHTIEPHDHVEAGATLSAASPPVPPAIVPSAVPSPSVTAPALLVTNETGGGGAHNNIQPSLLLKYAIVAL